MSGTKSLLGEEFVPLTPVHFFTPEHFFRELPKGHKGTIAPLGWLPDLSGLNHEARTAKVAGAWSEDGLLFEVAVEGDFDHPVFPQLEDGDSVELFIDTRDLKTAGFNHRFCHHFYFLPKAVDGSARAGEITRFRTEDSHDHCNPADLQLIDVKANQWQFWIPQKCLTGYDPQQFDRLGFTYRINRWARREPQHFTVHSREYAIDQQPALWSKIRLVK